jgi:hypothetical protein
VRQAMAAAWQQVGVEVTAMVLQLDEAGTIVKS